MARPPALPWVLVLVLVGTGLAGCLDAEGGLEPAATAGDPDHTAAGDNGTAPGGDGAVPNGGQGHDNTTQGNGSGDGNHTNGDGSNGNNTNGDGDGTNGNGTNGDGERPIYYGIKTGDALPSGGIDERYVLNLSPMRWSKTELDVLIVPPLHHPTGDGPAGVHDSRFLRAVEDSIVHWKEAIDQYGTDEMSGVIGFNVYVAGRDDLSPLDLGKIDIYIGNPPGGVSLQGVAAYPLNPRCVIANFGLPSASYELMFMVSAHEFGHCLGLSHPGENVESATDHDPWFDLMSYSWMNQPNSAPDLALDCISNLNLLAVHEAFAPAFGRQAKNAVTLAATDYFLTDCAERFLGED